MQEGLKELEVLLDPYDWFFEVVAEPFRYVVYVTTMNSEQDSVIPDKVQGKQVVVHFASAKSGSAQDYMRTYDAEVAQLKRLVAMEEELGEFPPGGATGGVAAKLRKQQEDILDGLDDVESPNTDAIGRELDKLEKQCGSNILQDIFYEIHDGKNAVTKLGERYPEVQTAMRRLYSEYGFDTIYNELDG